MPARRAETNSKTMRLTVDTQTHGGSTMARLECDVRVPLDVAMTVLRAYEDAMRPMPGEQTAHHD